MFFFKHKVFDLIRIGKIVKQKLLKKQIYFKLPVGRKKQRLHAVENYKEAKTFLYINDLIFSDTFNVLRTLFLYIEFLHENYVR